MNLYHKSKNNMEAGMDLKRDLGLPEEFCERTPDVVRFNYAANPEVVSHGKFSGLRTLEVKAGCTHLD